MHHDLFQVLCKLGICEPNSLQTYYPRVRDRDDIGVNRCSKSGIFILNSTEHMNLSHYETKADFSYWGAESRRAAINIGLEDNLRRFEDLKNIAINRKYLDIGTGSGAMLDLFAPVAREVYGIEPQNHSRDFLKNMGYQVFPSLQEITINDFELVSLFHVFEHLLEPLDFLIELRQKMKPGARIVLEVPHANDFLISFLNCEAFKAFTFWSEHLILHTRSSLEIILKAAGFSQISIKGIQRYPLANHLHWLSQAKPGGHQQWAQLRSPDLDESYAQMLSSLDMTDTLAAYAIA